MADDQIPDDATTPEGADEQSEDVSQDGAADQPVDDAGLSDDTAVSDDAEVVAEEEDPDAEELLRAAQAAVSELTDDAGQAVAPVSTDPEPVAFPDFGAQSSAPAGGAPDSLELLSDVDLDVKIELGRTSMVIEDVLRLNEGAVVELDKLAGDPVDVIVNNRIVARGEVLVLNDNFCVRINEVLDRATMEAAQRSGRAAS